MRRPDRTIADVSRRTVIRGATASLFGFGAVGNAAAHDEDEEKSTDEDEEDVEEEEETKDEETEDEEEGEDEEDPAANVVFSDQTVGKGNSANFVRIERCELSHGGYLSIHAYSRFEFAEGEDPDEYDVPEPKSLDHPVCESLIGITEYLKPGVHNNVKVPLLEPDSPAVELGIEDEGVLEKSQALIAIPHRNNTDPDDFECPDDPEYAGADDVDGAFANGSKDLDTVPVSHDLALVTRGPDSKEQKEMAKRQEELIREGVLVPQS